MGIMVLLKEVFKFLMTFELTELEMEMVLDQLPDDASIQSIVDRGYVWETLFNESRVLFKMHGVMHFPAKYIWEERKLQDGNLVALISYTSEGREQLELFKLSNKLYDWREKGLWSFI